MARNQTRSERISRKLISTSLTLLIPLFLVAVGDGQPLFSKLAVFLRPRAPRPTSFPSSASHLNKVFIHPQDQQVLQQGQISNGVYPSSSEHLNIMASNLVMQQGPLTHGIPVVSMDPSQNSITIMTPTGPEQIIPPGPNNGQIFVAQPISQNGNNHINIVKNNVTAPSPTPIVFGQGNVNTRAGNNNNFQGPAPTNLYHFLPSDGQHLIDGNVLSGAASSYGNFGPIPNMLPQFPNEHGPPPRFLHHPRHHPVFLHASNTEATHQMIAPPAPPPPPKLPKSIKGPAIIAVPKPHHHQHGPNPVLIPAPTYLSPVDHHLDRFVNPTSDPQAQPIIIQSIHQLPNLSPAFNSQQHLLLSSPENAIVKQAMLNLNRTKPKIPLKVKLQQEQKLHVVKAANVEVPQHFEMEVEVPPEHQHARLNILKMQPTTRPTQIPIPGGPESQNDNHQALPSDYTLSTIVNSPSTTITGSFEYPDPPTPPNVESMNALKYPSRFEDSAEVGVKDASFGQKVKGDNLSNAIGESGEESRKRVTTTAGAVPNLAASASTAYRRVTTAATTTTSGAPPRATLEEIMREKALRAAATAAAAKAEGKAFRPSPQIHSFEEPVSGKKSYITIIPPTTQDDKLEAAAAEDASERERKSLFSLYPGAESRQPAFDTGFKPVNHYLYAVGQAALPQASSTQETLYFDLIREVVSKAPNTETAWSEPDLTAYGEDAKRELVTSTDGLTMTTTPNHVITTFPSSATEPFERNGWKVTDKALKGGDDDIRQLTTVASSDNVEDWRHPDTTDASKNSIYFGNGKFGPPNCDKFHRFGFCPMNSGYPTDQVEKIATRCSALLSHLIAPLPKADVRYDVIVAKNGSLLKAATGQGGGGSSSWSWKSFAGKPVCDTKEIKIVPGWAKNEQGEWHVILQTKAWKQEAQITLCTPQGTHYNCKGDTGTEDCTPAKIKCVQRFTAQRLAVLDPENTDRCPVLRSVFLPSACVCLHETSEEIGSKSKSKKASKGKSSKKSSKSKSSSRTARSEDELPLGNSVEDENNKSDMMDIAADSSTSGHIGNPAQHNFQQDISPETTNVVPHAEKMTSTLISSATAAVGGEVEESQNEVENDNEAGHNSTVTATTTNTTEEEDRATTTIMAEPSDITTADESSASEE